MRLLKLCVVLGVLSAIAIPAGAIPLQYDDGTPWGGGPVKMDIISFDMGSLYFTDGTYLGAAAANAASQVNYPSASGHYYDITGKRDDEVGYDVAKREDGWGIFRVRRIYTPSDETLWAPNITHPGQPGQLIHGTDLVGIFYGFLDVAVVVSGNNVSINSTSATYDLYQQAFGIWDPAGPGQTVPDSGSAGRTGFSTYTGITGGTLVLRGTGLPGNEPVTGAVPYADTVFRADVTNQGSPPTTATGSFSIWLELTPGTSAYDQFNSDTYQVPHLGGGDNFADMTLIGDTKANVGPAVSDWVVQDQDPLSGNAIPEPFTMLGLSLGLGGLAGYLRKRRTA